MIGLIRRLADQPEWALGIASDIVHQLEEDSNNVLYSLRAPLKLRLVVEISEALAAERGGEVVELDDQRPHLQWEAVLGHLLWGRK